jgi:hypothetical protein
VLEELVLPHEPDHQEHAGEEDDDLQVGRLGEPLDGEQVSRGRAPR